MTLIYPGSFDPVTIGHIDIALRGAKLGPRLIVAVLDNPAKDAFFTASQRMDFLKESFADCPNIEVDTFSGLLAEYARLQRADAILRGLRSPGDFESEYRYAAANRELTSGIETIFIPANPSYAHISSSIVREAAKYIYSSGPSDSADSAIRKMVPAVVATALEKKLKGGCAWTRC